MNKLIFILLCVAGLNAAATEPADQKQLCNVASLSPTADDLRVCEASTAPFASMKACLRSTVMFDTFKECIKKAENPKLTAEEIVHCSKGTVMRFRFVACLEAASLEGVEAAEIAACSEVAKKTNVGISARGRLFIQCAEAAKDEQFTVAEIQDCGSTEREASDMRLCLANALISTPSGTGGRMAVEAGR
jgi:hypothetical protein